MDNDKMEHSELSSLNDSALPSYSATRGSAAFTTKGNGDSDANHEKRVPDPGDTSLNDTESVSCSHFESRRESHHGQILQKETSSFGEPLEASMSSEFDSGAKQLIQLEIEEITEKDSKDLKIRDWTRDQIIVFIATSLTNLLIFLSLTILAPFFPLEANLKGVSNTTSGWIFGVFSLVQLVASPTLGYLIPKIGSKFMFIAGLFICGGCNLIFSLLDRVDTSESTVTFVVLCLVTRMLLAVGCTGLFNSSLVILVKVFPKNVGTVFGMIEVFSGMGMVAGPAFGGFLYSAGGFIMPFAVIAGGWFVILPFLWYFIPPQVDTSKEENSGVSVKAILLYPKAIVNNIAIVVFSMVWSVLDPTLEPHLREFNIGPTMVGLLFLIMGVIHSLLCPLWGRLADRLPDNRSLLMGGLLVCALGMLLVGPSPLLGFKLTFNALWLTIVSLVILGIGGSMSIIPSYNVYIEVITELGYPGDTKSYGIVSGLWLSMFALGEFLGPSIGGLLFDKIGFQWLTTLIGGNCILTGVVVGLSWFIEKKMRSKLNQDYSTFITPSSDKQYHTLN